MIRLTVLYNLPEESDEEEYVAWRLSTHKDYLQSMPGIVHSDFASIADSWANGAMPSFRFQTTIDWPDRESFDQDFFNDTAQADLRENLKRLGEYQFIVSEILSA